MNTDDNDVSALEFIYPRNKEKRKKRREHARKLKGEKYTKARLGSSVRNVLKYCEAYDEDDATLEILVENAYQNDDCSNEPCRYPLKWRKRKVRSRMYYRNTNGNR